MAALQEESSTLGLHRCTALQQGITRQYGGSPPLGPPSSFCCSSAILASSSSIDRSSKFTTYIGARGQSTASTTVRQELAVAAKQLRCQQWGYSLAPWGEHSTLLGSTNQRAHLGVQGILWWHCFEVVGRS